MSKRQHDVAVKRCWSWNAATKKDGKNKGVKLILTLLTASPQLTGTTSCVSFGTSFFFFYWSTAAHKTKHCIKKEVRNSTLAVRGPSLGVKQRTRYAVLRYTSGLNRNNRTCWIHNWNQLSSSISKRPNVHVWNQGSPFLQKSCKQQQNISLVIRNFLIIMTTHQYFDFLTQSNKPCSQYLDSASHDYDLECQNNEKVSEYRGPNNDHHPLKYSLRSQTIVIPCHALETLRLNLSEKIAHHF